MGSPTIKWDFGTAYDMMVSLNVLHNPVDFGLRAAWAAGMRSRLPASERDFLEKMADVEMLQTQLDWLNKLDDPKDGTALLKRLSDTPVEDRLKLITHNPYNTEHKQFFDLFSDIQQRGKWSKDDAAQLQKHMQTEFAKYHKSPSQKRLDAIPNLLDWWAEPSEFGAMYLKVMETYYDVFFAEEERRIAPALNDAYERAHELSETLPAAELLEELSQGVR